MTVVSVLTQRRSYESSTRSKNRFIKPVHEILYSLTFLRQIDRQLVSYLCVPLIIGQGSVSLRSKIGDWNVALAELATRFRQFHTDVSVLVYDVAALFSEVLDNPTKYGFRNGTSYDGEDCVWLDILHPTSAMHKVIAADVARFLSVEGGENFQAKE
jgi:hypothetical protein